MFKLNCLFLVTILVNCQQSGQGILEAQHRFTNELVNESSPYLLQHAHNPVNWYPWGEDALKKASKEQKLMVISVGYAACHWCHVMEKESFEDSVVAEIMNKHYVSIKVDREERPDVDKIYMDASYIMTGRGGWPLNVIALPDGRPIFAGTYFPRSDWQKILEHVVGQYQEDPERLNEVAEKITEGIQIIETVELNTSRSEISPDELNTMHQDFMDEIDMEKGGRKGMEKFPTPSSWKYLMRYHYFHKDKPSLDALNRTLSGMANGGIYDHIGGGFARYSTDPDWRVPHFEKMLYDNAQLVGLYARAYQLTKNPLYRQVVYETTAFLNREMTSENGGFYSSYDADSEGEEGKFYVWTAQEMQDVLGDQADWVMEYFGVEKSGNWEDGKNILMLSGDTEKIQQQYNLTQEELERDVDEVKEKLYQIRAERVAPGLDDKILTSWNALAIIGYLDAYRVFDDKEFLDTALKTAEFLLENAKSSDGRLTRTHKDGKSSINGFLDDYGLFIQACIGLYEATFEERWLREAEQLTEYAVDHFFNQSNGMFYYTSDDDPQLITRKTELSNSIMPSSNSAMAHNLYYLGTYLYREEYLKMATQMLANILPTMQDEPIFYGDWAMLMLQQNQPLYEVAIMGPEWRARQKEFDHFYLPNVIYLGGTMEGDLELLANKLVSEQTTIYVCENKSCRLPVQETDKALQLMDPQLLQGIVDQDEL